ncbi:MAG: c-type cytochrome biogenesis protein CcmI [Rhodospirillaceae bacterium]|nr:c-type cytochrome biogenesis protein CcmI [Rhodospirillaceae bacterium]
MIWLVFGLITLAVVAAMIWPLIRGATATDDAAAGLAVFKDQLAEVDREVSRGTLSEAEAQAARLEIQRRMLAAGKRAAVTVDTEHPGLRAGVTAAMAVAVPFAALGAYLALGSPNIGGAPAAPGQSAGQVAEHGDAEMTQMVEQLAARMQAEPNNAEGWALLARSYRQIERFPEALDAYRRTLSLTAPTAELLADAAEMMTATSGGAVTDEALETFYAALNLDREEPRARFYIGMAAAQRDDATRAIAIWRDLTASAPPDAPWLEMVRNQMFQVAQATAIMPMNVEPAHPLDRTEPAPPPQAAAADADAVPPSDPDDITAPDVSALKGQFSGENLGMIQAMVGSLAGRLANDPADFEGWMMLGRSYTVLQNAAGAKDAFAKAIDLRPDAIEPKQQYLAVLWREAGTDGAAQTAEMAQVAEDILRVAPGNAEALMIRGQAQANSGDTAAARRTWTAAAAATPPGSPLGAEIARRMADLK